MPESHLVFREARSTDSPDIAALHADSWRRHYRGAYSDSFLDGDVEADRYSVWSARLAAPMRSTTILAESRNGLVGFVHVEFDDSPVWGSLIDNLHVSHALRRTGIGRQLVARAAHAIRLNATGPAMYLWVLEQNAAAQQFYTALGAVCTEIAPVLAPGGVPGRINGAPRVLRMAWSDTASLTD